MTTKENLSALIDAELNELDERRALKSLTDDAELRGTWERYHLIRAVMTRQLEVLTRPDFPERVIAKLDGSPERIRQAPLRFWPLLGGFAAAASIAAIAILTLQTFQQPGSTPGAQVAKVASTAAANGQTVVPVAASNVAPVAAMSSEDRLDLYLVGHNEVMPIAGMGGMLPYVRVVAHNQDDSK
jgi:sigma-E factor negative regulatory protein RseA